MPADPNRQTFLKIDKLQNGDWSVIFLYADGPTQIHEDVTVAASIAATQYEAIDIARPEAAKRFDALIDAHATIERNVIGGVLPKKPLWKRLLRLK